MIQTTKDELDYIASQLKPTIMESLKQYSVGVGEIELAASLEGVNSLPALKREGGVDKIVEVPLQLVTAPAEDAIQQAEEAANAANQAAQNANDAAEKVTDAVLDLTEERAKIDEAIGNAQEATDAANAAKDNVLAGEAGRVEAEEARVSAEQTRIQAEQERISAEQSRITAEAGRVAAESARVEAEETRVSEFATIKKDAETATKNANDAANNANSVAEEIKNTPKIQNDTWWIYDLESKSYVDTSTSATGRSPKIQDGTWWVWDDTQGIYVNTTISVSSDYELTKAKVENVLTGDIQTHYHSQYTVPTLDKVPDETTLTFKDGENTCNFVIGQFARVADSESEQGYTFYQLYDISNGKAVWAQGGSGGGDVREKVRINLSSNQPQPDNALIGATITVHDDTLNQDVYNGTWNGTEIIAKVTALSDYTVTVGEVEGYTIPASQQYTASIQGDRTANFVYNACLVSVNLSTNQSSHEDISGASVEVKYDDVTRTIQSGQSVKVPIGKSVTITASSVDRYATPEVVSFTAETASKSVDMIYKTCVLSFSLITNQAEHDDVQDADITVSYGVSSTTTVKVSQTVKVPYNEEVTVSVSEVADYKTPVAQSFTPDAPSKALSFTYNTCLLTVTISGLDGEPHTITVSYDSTTKNPSSGDTVKVPYGVSVTVSVSEVDGYAKPSDVVFTPNTASKSVDMPYTESAVHLTIASNQPDDETIAAVKATLSYNDTNVQISNGQTIAIPIGTEVTITFPEVEGYKTPETITFTNEGGLVEKSVTYQTEVVTVTLSAFDGSSVAGQKVTVNEQQYAYTDTPIVVKVPYGITYSVSADAKEGYGQPDAQRFTASQVSRAVSLVYEELAMSVIHINQTITDPATMISGDVNGEVIQWIRQNSHRVLAKKTGEGTVTYCRLNDADSNRYYDGSASQLDGAEGDVFVKLPTFYYAGTEGDEVDITFSRKPFEDSIEWDTNILIGVYEAYSSGSKAYSRSGVSSTGSVSQSSWKAYAKNRGEGYQLVDWQMHSVLGCLYYAMYGNTNCQAEIGVGTNSYTKTNGQTDSLGMTDTKASTNGNSQSINFWGLENWWGNKYEWMDDYENPAGTLTATVNDPVNGGKRQLDIPSAGYTGYYPKKMKFGRYLDLVTTDDDPKNGSDSVGFCDYQWWPGSTSSSIRVVRRSSYYSDAVGGVAYASAGNDSSDTVSSIGSRLAFRGVCTEAESVAAFKELPVL